MAEAPKADCGHPAVFVYGVAGPKCKACGQTTSMTICEACYPLYHANPEGFVPPKEHVKQ